MILKVSSQDTNSAVRVATQLSVCDNVVRANKLRQIMWDFV